MVAMAASWTLSGSCSSSTSFIRRNVSGRRKEERRRLPRVVSAEIKFVDGDEAKKLVTSQGYSIVDVRDQSQYERAHIDSSSHIPLFTVDNDTDVGTTIRRAMHNGFAGIFYGVAFTKPNPEFIAEVEKNFSKDSKLLLVCQEGMRSGTAAKKLEAAGFEHLACIDSGLQKIKPDLFPTTGAKQLQDAGKAGLVTVQGQFSAVLATVLISAYLFLTFFPTQAEDIFFKNS